MTTTISLADVQRLPRVASSRLECQVYDAPPFLLPNGSPRMTPLVADAQFLIGNAFLVTVRILRDGPGQPPNRLQMKRQALDIATGGIVEMPPYALGLLRAVFDIMASKQVIVNARRAARKARN